MKFRICPSCGAVNFFSAKNGDKIVFRVSESSRLITEPDQTFDEIFLTIDHWRVYCGSCVWSGPIHDLQLAYE